VQQLIKVTHEIGALFGETREEAVALAKKAMEK
jgi:predicted RNase H-like HicB family nuclease